MIALGWRRERTLAARLAPFLVLVYAQLLVAVNTERILALVLPAVIALALDGMRRESVRLPLPRPYLAVLPVTFLGLDLIVGARPITPAASTPGVLAVTAIQLLILVALLSLLWAARILALLRREAFSTSAGEL